MQTLEGLCRPILMAVCNYWQYIDAGFSPDKEVFRREILAMFSDAKEEAAKSPSLEREFLRMERPLVFFVDYMVKEGNFPFKNEWRELGRNYNELSGDEKFFDMLTDALDDPDTGSCLEMFYDMIGLGFCGIYQNDPEYIDRRMKVCASRFSAGKLDVGTEEITPLDYSVTKKCVLPPVRKIKRAKTWLAVTIGLLVLSFSYNITRFSQATHDYRVALQNASKEAIPKAVKDVMLYDAKNYKAKEIFSFGEKGVSDEERVKLSDSLHYYDAFQKEAKTLEFEPKNRIQNIEDKDE
ncbi:MAG: DotU family type IV/VI secretion system protein [Alphaproteobacteria bacterium]|nr:DotU family type IV/VI secretion system protein [Alphaproteobacteria bacterium]